METIAGFAVLTAFVFFLLGNVFGSQKLRSYGLGLFLIICALFALFS